MAVARRRTVVVAALVVAASVAAACGDSDDSERPGQADAYVVVLDWLLDQPEATFGEDCGDEVVFVESIGPDGIPLDVQVELIEHYTEEAELRFIDERGEAVDAEADGRPVRDGCVLVGLGIAQYLKRTTICLLNNLESYGSDPKVFLPSSRHQELDPASIDSIHRRRGYRNASQHVSQIWLGQNNTSAREDKK